MANNYESTVMRMAANIAGVVLTMPAPPDIKDQPDAAMQFVASYSVKLARLIVKEVQAAFAPGDQEQL